MIGNKSRWLTGIGNCTKDSLCAIFQANERLFAFDSMGFGPKAHVMLAR